MNWAIVSIYIRPKTAAAVVVGQVHDDRDSFARSLSGAAVRDCLGLWWCIKFEPQGVDQSFKIFMLLLGVESVHYYIFGSRFYDGIHKNAHPISP